MCFCPWTVAKIKYFQCKHWSRTALHHYGICANCLLKISAIICSFKLECHILAVHLKGAQFYFSTFSFLFHLKNHHYKDSNLKFQLKRSSCLNIQSKHCVSVIMVTIPGSFSIISSKWNDFQLWNLPWVISKIWACFWYKISKSLKKGWKNGLGSLNKICEDVMLVHVHKHCDKPIKVLALMSS